MMIAAPLLQVQKSIANTKAAAHLKADSVHTVISVLSFNRSMLTILSLGPTSHMARPWRSFMSWCRRSQNSQTFNWQKGQLKSKTSGPDLIPMRALKALILWFAWKFGEHMPQKSRALRPDRVCYGPKQVRNEDWSNEWIQVKDTRLIMDWYQFSRCHIMTSDLLVSCHLKVATRCWHWRHFRARRGLGSWKL